MEKKFAREIIYKLLGDWRVDCLALGEVTSEDLNELNSNCPYPDFSFYDGAQNTRQLKFDVGIIYNHSRIEINNDATHLFYLGSRRFKLANQVVMTTKVGNDLLNVFVSHWPSRGCSEELGPIRRNMGMLLRDKVNEIETKAPGSEIIVMGDFNDEPFDESLATSLFATRDRTFLKSQPKALYNPFWRMLGESHPHHYGISESSVSGTYFHRTGLQTKWRTFDQILFSSSFLGNKSWHLNERLTMIFKSEELLKSIYDSKSIFDHLPVLSAIERKLTA